MFPTWFVNVFNVCFYIGLPILLACGIKATRKDFKHAPENPAEYEDDFEEEETAWFTSQKMIMINLILTPSKEGGGGKIYCDEEDLKQLKENLEKMLDKSIKVWYNKDTIKERKW